MGAIDGRALAYEASPACRERQCSITYEHLINKFVVAYQHGPNPESVLLVDGVSHLASGAEAAARVRREFREFAERCHRYDDGEGIDIHG